MILRFINRLFLTLALAFVAFGALSAFAAQREGTRVLSNTVAGCLVLALGFLWAAVRCKKEGKIRLFLMVLSLSVVELIFQATAWLGLLPGVSTKVSCPYGRVYWTSEGLGNSIRNSDGWYYPEFDLGASNRIAMIGDSFVEAVEVHRTRNQAAVLQGLLKQDSPAWSVLALGTHGTSPAHHLDVLEYAQQHFQPREVILCLYLGNDITESSPALNYTPPADFIYYDLDDHNNLVLNPASADCRDRLRRLRESNHAGLFWSLPRILPSHCMMLQSALSIRDAISRRRRRTALQAAAEQAQPNNAAAREMGGAGLNSAPFAVNPTPEARRALRVMERELERCQEICERHGIRLRLVTIPVFPAAFYQTQKGRDWTLKIGDYDYLGPERELAVFALDHKLPLLALGAYLQARKLDVEDIRKLYWFQGTGHFTEAGHDLCARAIQQSFYMDKKH